MLKGDFYARQAEARRRIQLWALSKSSEVLNAEMRRYKGMDWKTFKGVLLDEVFPSRRTIKEKLEEMGLREKDGELEKIEE